MVNDKGKQTIKLVISKIIVYYSDVGGITSNLIDIRCYSRRVSMSICLAEAVLNTAASNI